MSSDTTGSDAYVHPDPLVKPTGGNAMQGQNAQQRAIPRPSCGMPYRTLTGGVSFYGDRKSRGGSSVADFPFRAKLKRVDGDLKAIIYPGTVSGRMPTIDSVELDAGTPPQLALTGSGTERIYLAITATLSTTASGYVLGYSALPLVTINVATTVPDDDLTGIYCRHIATVVDGVLTAQVIQNSLDIVVRDTGFGDSEATAIFQLSG